MAVDPVAELDSARWVRRFAAGVAALGAVLYEVESVVSARAKTEAFAEENSSSVTTPCA